MNKEEILGAFSLVNNPIVLSEEEVKDVQKAIKELQQENQKYKEVIDKAIDFIKNGDLLYLANKNSVVYRNNIEIRAVADRLNNLLQILEDKVVSDEINNLKEK